MTASIRTRLIAAFLAVALLSAAGLSLYFLGELERYALRKLEERLYTEAMLVASLAGPVYEQAGSAGPGTMGDAEARLLDPALSEVGDDLSARVRVLDAEGRTVADSSDEPAGTAHGDAPEVQAALAGRYGAHTRVLPDGRVALYVAAPLRVSGRIAGAAYASSTTFSIRTLVWSYRFKLAGLVAAFVIVALLLAEGLARWLARPLRDLERAAVSFPGDHSVRATPSGSRETRAVAEAFNSMADEVQGVVTELRGEELRKSRFVSDVSHELRTPLTAIRGAAETLATADVPPGDAERFLNTIVSESDRLTRLTSDLMTLQRIEGATGELPLHRLDLGEVSRRAVSALEPLTSARGVDVRVTGSLPAVLGDPDRLQQVIANLVENASRVSPEGGVVEVELSAEGRWAVLSVLDSGPGIAEKDLPRIFDRFYRADPSRERGSGGFGLGLAIVRAIVTAHSGEIEAAPRPGGGMRFTVRLPALPE